MPRVCDHLVKSAIRLLRQSTTVPNTSNTSAFTAEISDMVASPFLLSLNSLNVIARSVATKQSISPHQGRKNGLLRRYAPRNDVERPVLRARNDGPLLEQSQSR